MLHKINDKRKLNEKVMAWPQIYSDQVVIIMIISCEVKTLRGVVCENLQA